MKNEIAANGAIATRAARSLMQELRLELLQQKRRTVDPRAPMRARPGEEKAFAKAGEDLAAADFILKLLENEERRERARVLYDMKRKAVKTADALLDGAIVFGLASAAMLGVGAVAVLLNFPDTVVRTATVLGVGIALAWTAARK